MIKPRYLVILCDLDRQIDTGKIDKTKRVEIYNTNPKNLDQVLENALFDDLYSPMKLIFVGGDVAKNAAKRYRAEWIPCTPSTEQELSECLNIPPLA